MSESFHPGQRWTSESEPELGLGSVLRANLQTVTVRFGASGETRQYARDNAPLRRVRFRAGDKIKSQDGQTITVQNVAERQGLLHYVSANAELCETELCDTLSFNQPEERLLAGQLDSTEIFDLRMAALDHQHCRRQSAFRGFTGGRIDLIPHQLYIASEVTRRLVPRVLLADEVGLGKTIEAGLILHRLILTGRAQRVLILVPESLVHQWFVELLRRFNLWFHIFDEERCEAIESTNPEANPFLDDQLILCSLGVFTANERRLQQAIDAGWDILVVDEAHHLGWSPEAVSPEYAVVDALGRRAPGLLLLTATPEQLGVTSHFARLRLLDADRFFDLEEFILEAGHYREVARLAEKLLSGVPFAPEEAQAITRIVSAGGDPARFDSRRILEADEELRTDLLGALLDQHGTGRVMFRNTRLTISGFPSRHSALHPLSWPSKEAERWDQLAEEFAADTDPRSAAVFEPDFTRDPRIPWLADLLRALDPAKVLLITRTRLKVEAIESALRQHLTVKMAVFHEGLPLVRRDRNAAWFSEEDGARLLICSEIGSEGRNFQFAHHLVLFDLPLDPELLEQRIGRLDRIGQREEIRVHVPYVTGSPQEALARWFHEGLNSLEQNLHGGQELLEQFGPRLQDLAQDYHETHESSLADLDHLIEQTKTARREITERLERGRDRLLELHSFRPEAASALVHGIRQQDQDRSVDEFMVEVFDHYAIQVEELSHRTFQLGSAGVFADSFPGLPPDGLTVTCDRQRALARDDVQFLTWDHPLVTGALDLLLGSEKGNSSFAHWPDRQKSGLYLEAIFVLECIAPPQLHIDRFLPPTPVRILVDHRGEDVSQAHPSPSLAVQLKRANPYALFELPNLRDELLPRLVEEAHRLASRRIIEIVVPAQRIMNHQLALEIARLRDLQKVNRSVRPEEIDLLVAQQGALNQHLKEARLRLDAVRLIQRGWAT